MLFCLVLRFQRLFDVWKTLVGGKEIPIGPITYSFLAQSDIDLLFLSSDRYPRRPVLRTGTNGGGPFVPVPKKCLLAYQPEERKSRSISDIVGKLHELDRLEFSFPPAGVFQTAERR